LALFGRRLSEREDGLGMPASENLHMCGLMHRSKWNPYSITWSARPSSVAGYRSRVPWRAATDVGRRANNAVSHGRCL